MTYGSKPFGNFTFNPNLESKIKCFKLISLPIPFGNSLNMSLLIVIFKLCKMHRLQMVSGNLSLLYLTKLRYLKCMKFPTASRGSFNKVFPQFKVNARKYLKCWNKLD